MSVPEISLRYDQKGVEIGVPKLPGMDVYRFSTFRDIFESKSACLGIQKRHFSLMGNAKSMSLGPDAAAVITKTVSSMPSPPMIETGIFAAGKYIHNYKKGNES